MHQPGDETNQPGGGMNQPDCEMDNLLDNEGDNYTALCDRYSGSLASKTPSSTHFSDLSEFWCSHYSKIGVPASVEKLRRKFLERRVPELPAKIALAN